ncbi:hypothetical protein [Candidatus Hepatoplasma crinochetorum]|uniref:hypothetical protein n=1 Tax=Candidatus Hepatoplasma crinochetorum TaxID=295596 RepID=UPI00308CFDB3|nr:MAG: hypothetical protein HCTKY_2500 [Candidatus Hepatoplasma crinochetorum]
MKKFIFNIFSLIILTSGLLFGSFKIDINNKTADFKFPKYQNNQTDINQLIVGLDQSFYFDLENKIIYQNNYDLTLQVSPDNSENWIEKEINNNLFLQGKEIFKNAMEITYDLNFQQNSWNNWNTNFYFRDDSNLLIGYFTDYYSYDYLYFEIPEEVNLEEIIDFGYINNQFIILFANGDLLLDQTLYQYDQDSNSYFDFTYLNQGKIIDFTMTDNYLFAVTDQGAVYQYGKDIFDFDKNQDSLLSPILIYSYDSDLDKSYYYTYEKNQGITSQIKNDSPIEGPVLSLYLEATNGTSDYNHLIFKTDRNFYQIYYYQNYLLTIDIFFKVDNYNLSYYEIKENHFNNSDIYAINTDNQDNNYLYKSDVNDFTENNLKIINFNLLTETEETSIDGYTSPIYNKEIINFEETEVSNVYLVKTNDELEYLVKLIIDDNGEIIYYQVSTYNWIHKINETVYAGKSQLITQTTEKLEFKISDVKINSDRSLNEINLNLKVNNVTFDDSYYKLSFEGVETDQNGIISYYFKINLKPNNSNSLIYLNYLNIYDINNELVTKDIDYQTYTLMRNPILATNNNFKIIENDEDETDTSFYFDLYFFANGDFDLENDQVVKLNAIETSNGESKDVVLDAIYVQNLNNNQNNSSLSEINEIYQYKVENLDENAEYSDFMLTVTEKNVVGEVQTENLTLSAVPPFISGSTKFPIFAYVLLIAFILLFIAILTFYYLNYVYNKKTAEKIEYTFENWDTLSQEDIIKNDKTIKTSEYQPKTTHKTFSNKLNLKEDQDDKNNN